MAGLSVIWPVSVTLPPSTVRAWMTCLPPPDTQARLPSGAHATPKNAASPVDQDIATVDSKTRVLVIRAEEDWEIARQCYRVQKDAS